MILKGSCGRNTRLPASGKPGANHSKLEAHRGALCHPPPQQGPFQSPSGGIYKPAGHDPLYEKPRLPADASGEGFISNPEISHRLSDNSATERLGSLPEASLDPGLEEWGLERQVGRQTCPGIY